MPTTHFAIVPHTVEPRLLLLPHPEGWTLPFYLAEESEEELEPLDLLNSALKSDLGMDLIVLRVPSPPHKIPGGDVVLFYWMENRAPGALPPGARWLAEDELNALPGLDSLQVSALEAWFEDSRSTPSPHRSPWARTGWHDEASAWITQQLRSAGHGAVVSIEQVRSWTITHVMRVTTDEGIVYFKAAHAMFAQEAGLTRFLSRRYPSHVPAVIAADPDRNWLLMESFQGTPLADTTEALPWQESFRLFARMQIESLAWRDQLLALRCFDRPLAYIPWRFAALLEDSAALNAGGRDLLSESQIEALHEIRPRVESALETLAAYNLPAALLHGDLHPNNVVVTASGPLIYDWSDGAMAHPFFELLTTTGTEIAGVDLEAHELLLRAYLEPWASYTAIEDLEAAFALSRKLLPCYHALSYYWIVQNTEPGALWELGGGVAYFLKKLLEAFGHNDPDPTHGAENWVMT